MNKYAHHCHYIEDLLVLIENEIKKSLLNETNGEVGTCESCLTPFKTINN